MRWLVLAIALVGAGCFNYEPPEYDLYAFKCDDAHACPDGQMCLGNLCQYVGPDRDGVRCGTVQCPKEQQCCFDSITTFCLATHERCDGGYGSESALCDNAEDCPMGTACCYTAGTNACTPNICEDRVCLDESDCGGAHYCCPNDFYPDSPFKRCSTDPC